jgi:UDPglucose 6-dehydrogenase
LRAVENVNRRQKQLLFGKLNRFFGGNLQGKTFAVWGLAFKPNTDDMRGASSRDLLEALWKAGARVRAYDPVAMKEAQRLYGDRADLVLCDSAEAALQDADALVIVTEWREFRSPDFERIKAALKTPVIFDGRNIYDPTLLKRFGLEYYGVGRGASIAAA